MTTDENPTIQNNLKMLISDKTIIPLPSIISKRGLNLEDMILQKDLQVNFSAPSLITSDPDHHSQKSTNQDHLNKLDKVENSLSISEMINIEDKNRVSLSVPKPVTIMRSSAITSDGSSLSSYLPNSGSTSAPARIPSAPPAGTPVNMISGNMIINVAMPVHKEHGHIPPSLLSPNMEFAQPIRPSSAMVISQQPSLPSIISKKRQLPEEHSRTDSKTNRLDSNTPNSDGRSLVQTLTPPSSSTSSPPPLPPPHQSRIIGAESYFGFIESLQDVMLLMEASSPHQSDESSLRHPHVPIIRRVQQRLSERDRTLIRSGSVFLYVERESGIRRWTDGKVWSPSRICGEFLLYREVEERITSSRKNLPTLAMNAPPGAKLSPSVTLVPRSNGLMKKTICLKTDKECIHLVCYFEETHMMNPQLMQMYTPSKNQYFQQLLRAQQQYCGTTMATHHFKTVSSHSSSGSSSAQDDSQSVGEDVHEDAKIMMEFFSTLDQQSKLATNGIITKTRRSGSVKRT